MCILNVAEAVVLDIVDGKIVKHTCYQQHGAVGITIIWLCVLHRTILIAQACLKALLYTSLLRDSSGIGNW